MFTSCTYSTSVVNLDLTRPLEWDGIGCETVPQLEGWFVPSRGVILYLTFDLTIGRKGE